MPPFFVLAERIDKGVHLLLRVQRNQTTCSEADARAPLLRDTNRHRSPKNVRLPTFCF